jgi:hypothetical protein
VDALTAARAVIEPAEEPCPTAQEGPAGIFLFPPAPRAGETVRLVAVSRQAGALGQLQAQVDDEPLPLSGKLLFRAPPQVLEARLKLPRPGTLRVRLTGAAAHRTSACLTVEVPETRRAEAQGSKPSAVQPSASQPWATYTEVWPVRAAWDHHTEDLFGAWVARLFHVEAGGQGGWLPLHQLTRDSSRNWLHNALGLAEDDPESSPTTLLLPDCGDLPYFLRAYFAWKLGLPFAFQRCTRGDAVVGPNCPVSRDNLTTRFAQLHHPVRRFNAFAREWIGWGVHSGTARTTAEDNGADFYPVALDADALRPGRIFVDPAGHVYVLSQQLPGSERQLGLLFGVDAHPDRTISRKRFSQGTFVFDARIKTGGFKAFRPVVYEGGRIRRLTNAELDSRRGYEDYSLEQPSLEHSAELYDRVQRALNPKPVDPLELLASKIHALHEASLERVKAVEMGVEHMRRTGWKPIWIPKGPAIFETEGPWEIYSTPARDLRLLMAMEEVLSFPRQALRERSMYRVPAGWTDARLAKELHAVMTSLPAALKIVYPLSDGSGYTLTLTELISRRERLQMGYHPNDCPEIRWGAPEGSEEASHCRQRALPSERAQMRSYEHWFARLQRPPQKG